MTSSFIDGLMMGYYVSSIWNQMNWVTEERNV